MATIREGLKKLYPGTNPENMAFEGEEMDEDAQMSAWLSTTGKSDMRVNWEMAKEYQKFWLWTRTGVKDLGDEELEGRDPNEVWTSLRHGNSGLT
jgi:hypothetical protein